MSTIKSSDEHLTLNADGSGNDIKFQSNGSEVASISDGGVVTATSFAGSGAALTGVGVSGITSSADSTAMTIGSDENITISNSNNADTVLTIDSQTANGNIGILKLAGDVAGAGYGAGSQSAKINFFQSAEHICTISSKRSEGDEGELSFQTRDASDAAPVERLIIKKDGRGLSQFTAKAWIAFNGNGTSIGDSHNVSSLGDWGTGDYGINFANSLAQSEYCVQATTTNNKIASVNTSNTAPTTGRCDIEVQTIGGSMHDAVDVYALFFGD